MQSWQCKNAWNAWNAGMPVCGMPECQNAGMPGMPECQNAKNAEARMPGMLAVGWNAVGGRNRRCPVA